MKIRHKKEKKDSTQENSIESIPMAEKIRNIVADQLTVELDQVTNEANFVTDLGADSLDLVELIMSLEEEFDITISDEEAEKISTVGDAIDGIKTLLQRQK